MSELIAKPIVKNKFWVVENQGEKIATIQAREGGGYVYVHDDSREFYSSTKDIKQKLNIKFDGQIKKRKEPDSQVYGYPIKGKGYNKIFDVKKKIPVYTKTLKSKSCFCAGYYIVKINQQWTEKFCPKTIYLNRYEFFGPYYNKDDAQKKLKEENEKLNHGHESF